MKFQFKIQPFQTEAVESVVNVFKGQPNRASTQYVMDKGVRYVVIGGKRVRDDQIELEFDSTGHRNADIRLSDDQLLGNLHTVQDGHGIKRSSDVDTRLGRCGLDIEMETGTGKTYV